MYLLYSKFSVLYCCDLPSFRMIRMNTVKIGDLMEIGVGQEVHQMEATLTVRVMVGGVMTEIPDIPMETEVLAMIKMITRKVLVTLRLLTVDLAKRPQSRGLRTAGLLNQRSQILGLQTTRKKLVRQVLLYGQ
jgi:hypothetical protein